MNQSSIADDIRWTLDSLEPCFWLIAKNNFASHASEPSDDAYEQIFELDDNENSRRLDFAEQI